MVADNDKSGTGDLKTSMARRPGTPSAEQASASMTNFFSTNEMFRWKRKPFVNLCAFAPLWRKNPSEND